MLCLCGCRNRTNGDSHFLPGHDLNAVRNVIRENYGASNEQFLKSKIGSDISGPFGHEEIMHYIMEEHGSIEAFLFAEGYHPYE